MNLSSGQAVTYPELDADPEETARSFRVAQVISIAGLPPLLAIAALVTLSSYAIADAAEAARVALVSSFFIAVAPAIYIAYLLRSNRIEGGVDLALREERLRPYLVGTGSSALGFLVLLWLAAPQSILVLALCYALNGAVMAAITQRWKISAHAAGAAVPATALVSVIGPAALPFAVMVPVVCWARVRVHMHTVTQVCAGAVLGFALTWLQLTLLGPRL